MNIKNILLKSAGLNAIGSAINLLMTVLMVRWYGEAAYSNYIIDLAMLSTAMIAIETVPSNYAVHYVQDDPEWIKFIAAHIFYSAILLVCLSYLVGVFFAKNFSIWMCFYVFSVAYKRYIDIRLQSTGKMEEFFFLEFCISLIKISVLAVLYFIKIGGSDSIWVALAIANILCFSVWFIFNRKEVKIFSAGLKIKFTSYFYGEINKFKSYYYGILIKKLKDNALPLIANFCIKSSAELAAFFLAYRGVVFSVGQIRIMEALLNNKKIVKIIESGGAGKKHVIAFAAFIFCFCSSILICYFSGIHINYEIVFAMSLLVIPISYQIFARAKAYAEYHVGAINMSMVSYILFLIIGGGVLGLYFNVGARNFSLLVVGAEIFGLVIILTCRKKDEKSDN